MLVMTLVYEPEHEKEYLTYSKVGLQAADNVFQWNMIEGLRENIGENSIKICNSVPVGSYPWANRKLFYKGSTKQTDGILIHNVGFLNIPIIKPISRFFSFVHELLSVPKCDNRVLAYGLYLPQLLAFYVCRHIFHKSLDITLVIDDLPAQYGIIHGNRIAKKIKTVIGNLELVILNDRNVISHYVLLTEHMLDAIKLNGRNYSVVEGIAKSKYISEKVSPAALWDKKIVFYAGTLDKQFGIDLMLDAFSQIKGNEYEFWICGNGGARERVEQMQQMDSRIRYFGFVDKQRADTLMCQASVLINPRPNDAAFTRYSFPSKTIEYMLTGIPVLMYKLDGIPKEYDQYLSFITEATAESIVAGIEEICGLKYNQYLKTSQESADWVRKNKNPKAQMRKVLALDTE